jgi:hypothetical protein
MLLAKQTFIYEAQKLSYSVTRKPVMRGTKVQSKKRDRKGKIIAETMEDSADHSVGDSGAASYAADPCDLLS